MKGNMLKSIKYVLMCFIMLLALSKTAGPLYAAASVTEKNDTAKPVSIFSDIDTNSQLYPYVRYITECKLVEGFPDGTYRPDESVTRAQLAAIAVKVKGLPLAVPDSQTFNDVIPGYWAYGVIETAAGAGIFRGYPDGSFNPEGIITNAEAAVILTALSGGELTDKAPAIGDLGPQHWAYRQVATAVRAGLAETVPGNLFNPDQGFSRRALARGLGMAYTRGPSLRGAELTGELSVKKGTVTVTVGEGDPLKVTGKIKLSAGTKIVTGMDGQAEITYDDGTGLLIEAGSELTVGAGKGMKYIRSDGMPGVTVDQLQIRLEKGRIFGALATMYEQAGHPTDNREETPGGRNLAARKGLLASTSIMPDVGLLLAQNGAAEEYTDWWDQPVAQRTRVVVDMPWGVAGIRGTFWRNEVGSAGQSTSLITGSAVITAGGRSVSLGGGQSTTITSSGAPPAAPAALTQAERQVWQEMRNWVQQRAQEIQNNLPPAPPAAVPLQPNQQPPAPPNIVSLVTQSLTQATSNTGRSSNRASEPVSEDDSLAGWTANGLWRAVGQNSGIKNMAIGKYVSLPEGDSSGGYLPNAPSGGKCFWYGRISSENNYAVGNYLNEQAESDQDFSGGTSAGEHSGVLTSPLFTVPEVGEGQIPILSFKSWWEIEGVNPDGFDQMEVSVLKEGSLLPLGKLNPAPYDGNSHLPYTSGGYNHPAAWKSYAFSLDGCQGSQVKFTFKFSTGDSQFNGFRGWLIDQVKVDATSTGSVGGKVSDGTNPVEGAEVTVTLGGQEYNGITGADGSYLIGDVIPGSGYTVTASKEGYLEGSVTGISVSSGQVTANVDIALEVYTEELSIEYSDPAPLNNEVPVEKVITLVFNRNIVPGEEFTNISVMEYGQAVDVLCYAPGSDILTIVPQNPLVPGYDYEVCIPAGAVEDLEGHSLIDDLSLSFSARVHVWKTMSLDYDGTAGGHTSVAMDSEGYPHISYYDSENGHLKYTSVTPSGWPIETVESAVYAGEQTSIALDYNDTPHISYYDQAGGYLKYAYKDGGSWNTSQVDSTGYYPSFQMSSIKLNSLGHPCIAYYDVANRDLKYAFWDGDEWARETVDGDGNVGNSLSLVLDCYGNPHIAYHDQQNGDLKYAFKNGESVWTITTVDTDGGWIPSLGLDYAGRPHISHVSCSTTNLKYAFLKSDNTWEIEVVDDKADFNTSIAVDRVGYPHIAYYSSGNGDNLQYARKDYTGWNKTTVDHTGDVGAFPSLALDKNNRPVISYMDSDNSYLKLSWWTCDIFSAEANMNTGRKHHTANLLNNGKVLIAGGLSADVLDTAEIFNPGDLTFETVPGTMNSPRINHSSAELPDGKILLISGAYNILDDETETCDLFDPATGVFTPTGDVNTAREWSVATSLSSAYGNKVLVTGGVVNSGDAYTDSAELYDPQSGTFTTVSDMVYARDWHTSTLLPDGNVLIAGGREAGVQHATAELYNPASSAFTLTDGSMSIPRLGHTATLLQTGKVLITGGWTDGYEITPTAEIYDPATGLFEPTGTMNFGRRNHTATLLPSGKVLVTGVEAPGLLAPAELYDPDTGQFTVLDEVPYGRIFHTATLLKSGAVLIVGGIDGGDNTVVEIY